MSFSKLLIAGSFFVCMVSTNIISQSITETLQFKEIKEKSLETGEVHTYSLDLEKDQFVIIELMQIGIDLIIKVTDPTSESVGVFDSPNGTNGLEWIQFTTTKTGSYQVEISSIGDEGEVGDYSIILSKIKKAASGKEEKVDQLFSRWDNSTSPGSSVAIVQNGKTIFTKGYGMANLEYDIPNTDATIFHIASISKQFTAFAIAILDDQGMISLDDEVGLYIEELPDFGEKITIRHLVHHTSGLRDQWNLLAMAGWRLDDVITKNHILKLVARQKELNFKPGSKYTYCNTGFTLLAEIVERVTGESFPSWCDKNIFKPLGMKHTLFYDDHERIVKNRAYSYSENGSEYKKNVLSYANVGATSLFTTAQDLAKWAKNFENVTVGNDQIMAQMHQRGILNNGDTLTYAFGQVMGNYKGLAQVSHGGADAGYRTYLGRFPDQNFSVVVLSNLGSFNPRILAMNIVDIFLKDHFEKETIEKTDTQEKLTEEQSDSKPIAILNESLIRKYQGTFELQPGFNIKISFRDGKLTGQATNQPAFELKPQNDSTFFVTEANATIVFRQTNGQNVKQFTLEQGGNKMVCTRIQEFDTNSIDFSVLEGDYYSEELATTYSIIFADDQLIARHQRHPDITLTPSKKNLFKGNKWFFNQIEFVQEEDGSISGMKVSSGRVQGLKFTRQP